MLLTLQLNLIPVVVDRILRENLTGSILVPCGARPSCSLAQRRIVYKIARSSYPGAGGSRLPRAIRLSVSKIYASGLPHEHPRNRITDYISIISFLLEGEMLDISCTMPI